MAACKCGCGRDVPSRPPGCGGAQAVYASKQCRNAAFRRNNPDYWRRYSREYRNRRNREWYRRHRETQWERNVKSHGITVVRYLELLDRQNGLCAICGTGPAKERRLAIDHDHGCCPKEKSCGKCVRGLLCGRCNRGLGSFRDEPDVLRKAVDYLEFKAIVGAG